MENTTRTPKQNVEGRTVILREGLADCSTAPTECMFGEFSHPDPFAATHRDLGLVYHVCAKHLAELT